MKFIHSHISIAALFLLGACGGSGVSSENTRNGTPSEHFIIDSPVQGLHYECGKLRGITDERGMFKCAEAPVTFKLGQLLIAQLPAFTADHNVFLQDFYDVERDNPTDPRVVNMAMFLQSLDNDGEIASSINIPQNITDRFIEALDLQSEEIRYLATIAGVTLVSEQQAIDHLTETIRLYITQSSEHTNEDINISTSSDSENSTSSGVSDEDFSVSSELNVNISSDNERSLSSSDHHQ